MDGPCMFYSFYQQQRRTSYQVVRADQSLRRDGGGGRGNHDLSAAARGAADSDHVFEMQLKNQFNSHMLLDSKYRVLNQLGEIT